MPSYQDPHVLQIPCGHSGCLRYFKTERGRKTHVRSAHSILIPFSAPQTPSPPSARTPTPSPIPNSHTISDPPFESGSWDQDEDGWDQERFTPPPSRLHSPFAPDDPPDENIQFFGLGNKYYRHYHPKLTGKFFSHFSLHSPLIYFQHNHAMSMENFSNMAHHHQSRSMIHRAGFHITASFNLRPPSFSTQNARCRHQKSMLFLTFGPAHCIRMAHSHLLSITVSCIA